MATQLNPKIRVQVYDQRQGSGTRYPVANAHLLLLDSTRAQVAEAHTLADGTWEFTQGLKPGATYTVQRDLPAINLPRTEKEKTITSVDAKSKCSFNIGLDAQVTFTFETGAAGGRPGRAFVGETVFAALTYNLSDQPDLRILPDPPWHKVEEDLATYSMTVHRPGTHAFRATIFIPLPAAGMAAGAGAGTPEYALVTVSEKFIVEAAVATPISGQITVAKSRTASFGTRDLALDALIRRGTDAMSFCNYMDVINKLFCKGANSRLPPCGDGLGGLGQAGLKQVEDRYKEIAPLRSLPFVDADSYRVLKAATEAFVMVNCAVADNVLTQDEQAMLDEFQLRDIGVTPNTIKLAGYLGATGGSAGMLPYLAIIRRKLPDIPITIDAHDAELCFGILQRKLSRPCMVELIWSYWHEEAMLVQTMNVITRRFQNVGSGTRPDPLANLEIDPLRPLNNLLWGYVQDEQHRLTVVRRSYEYDHQYGLRLDGRAVQNFRPADSRSRFLEAFHQLLRRVNSFYRQDDDTNVKADAFPVLNAIKEVHMILSQGAHNQFGDLPSTARVEMLMQQWLLARSEFREFLPTRIMVAYPEPWMDRVDAMKKLQGWTDISVMHFNALATFGEQLLLSIRYGAWSTMFDAVQAFNWARLWRPQVQGYIHSYRAVTGVDLSTEQPDPAADGTLPSVLLLRRLAEQARRERSL